VKFIKIIYYLPIVIFQLAKQSLREKLQQRGYAKNEKERKNHIELITPRTRV